MAQKILIVEDNADLSQLLAFCLNDVGYETSRAGNSAQGISKVLAERPDLIINSKKVRPFTEKQLRPAFHFNFNGELSLSSPLTRTLCGTWQRPSKIHP